MQNKQLFVVLWNQASDSSFLVAYSFLSILLCNILSVSVTIDRVFVVTDSVLSIRPFPNALSHERGSQTHLADKQAILSRHDAILFSWKVRWTSSPRPTAHATARFDVV